MINLEIKQLEEKSDLNADALMSLRRSSKGAIEPVKLRKSCLIIIKGGKQ